MSLHSRKAQAGNLTLTIYDFERIGDELPQHVHDDKSVHITIVARGAVLAFGEGWDLRAEAGACLEWAVNQPHGIRALEDNARIFNIPKGVS